MPLWFRAKRYGWGWTPITIQGWLVLAAYVAAVTVDVVVLIHRVRADDNFQWALTTFCLWLAGLVATLIAVCWLTGERPGWRWGN
jgi:hypothetical protein